MSANWSTITIRRKIKYTNVEYCLYLDCYKERVFVIMREVMLWTLYLGDRTLPQAANVIIDNRPPQAANVIADN